jgi:glycosyltransferase involved in cell wall biosynthesis
MPPVAKSTKLRIAQVAPLWTPIPPRTYGGIELMMMLLIDDLVARGHDVTLFASADCTTSAKLHPVCEINLTELTAENRAYLFEYYANSMVAEVLQHARDFDVIHFHVGTAWLPFANASPTPALFTLHSSPTVDDEWIARRWPNVPVVGISRCQTHGLGLRTGREFPVVYNGCDFDAYDARFEPGEYLVFLGRMGMAKNPLDAIRVAQAVGMPLVLAGQPQNSAEERYFAEEIKPLIDGEHVRCCGAVNHAQKNELLRHAAALLFPIQWDEPFGLVMIEAMACGTPVVAHRRGSVEEVVDDGITGFHASAMDALPELVPRALQLDRRTVRAHAQERFGFRRMVDDYLALYHQVIHQHSS